MKKLFRNSLWGVALSLLVVLSLPLWFTQWGRNLSVGGATTLSKQALKLRAKQEPLQKEIAQLKLENTFLKQEVARAYLWAIEAGQFKHHVGEVASDLSQEKALFAQVRAKHLYGLLKQREKSLPAKVILREAGFWSSRIWINVGERENRALKNRIVAKDSPVVWGKELIGIVEAVHETRSLVRLITDRELTISVCAVRGNMRYRYLQDKINALIVALTVHEKLKVQKPLLGVLERLKKELALEESNNLYLAKGEIWGTVEGAKGTVWRTDSLRLKGGGFTYEISDLNRSEKELKSSSAVPINSFLLQPGDLLVTTGIDGVFPPDLVVATVSKIGLNQEIEAIPAASLGTSLSEVLVLPPL